MPTNTWVQAEKVAYLLYIKSLKPGFVRDHEEEWHKIVTAIHKKLFPDVDLISISSPICSDYPK
jgi:hypothetical protein